MYNRENLRAITNTGNKGGNLYFYFNEDGSDITADGFFKDVRLSIGDVIQVYNGETIAEYQVDSKSGNDKTVIVLRDVDTIKNDLDDLGDEVSGIQEKIPGSATSSNQLATASDVNTVAIRVPVAPTEPGTYDLTVVVAEGVDPVYSWTERTE